MPWINLDGAVNVRDLGGLPTLDGGKTAERQLLRADNLQELTAADVSRLVHDIGLTTVVDLRSTAELESEGPAPLDAVASVRHLHYPVLPEVGENTDVIAEALLLRRQEDRSRYPGDPWTGHYLGYLEDRPDQVIGAVRGIATSEGAAIVHCAAGKDRTGTVIGLTLSAVGVRPEAIIADFAASGERIDAILDRLKRSPTYAEDLEGKPVDVQTPRPRTMAALLEQIEARYGGAARWLEDHGLGDDLPRLRAKLLVA
jgi:protein-tyrosine phosphatase